MWRIFLLISPLLVKSNAHECVPLNVDNNLVACVCNATYCDDTPPYDPNDLENGNFYWYVTNKEGSRMKMSRVKFSTQQCPSNLTLIIDRTKKYQTIFGFGGAFTDSAGINIKKLSPKAQDQLIRTYYDPKSGSRYTLGRIPIASTDFSTRPYTYDDSDNDDTLKHFALAKEDYDYKIPYAVKALQLNPETKFFSAAWSPPSWMKTNNELFGFGFLKKECYQLYADYLLRFLDEYKKNGIDMWAITTGNECFNAFIPDLPLLNLGWTPDRMADWIGNNMGPTLANSIHNSTLILALDDNRIALPWFVNPVFTDEKSKKYTAGIAVHWYQDAIEPALVLDITHNAFPNKFLLMTEASTRPSIWGTPNVMSKLWNHGEQYILSIIEYMNHWTIGWVDWNLVLDELGGPNWANNTIDAAIIVKPDTDEFYKLPMYYAIKHFSRFVDRGSVRIFITDNHAVKSTAFLTPSNETVVVLYNRDNISRYVTLKDSKNKTLCLVLSPSSMNTLIYKH